MQRSQTLLKVKYLTEPQPYGGYQPTYGVYGHKPYGMPSHYGPPPIFDSYGVNYPPPAAEPYTPPTYGGYNQPQPGYGSYGVTNPPPAPYTPPSYGGYSKPPAPQPYSTYFTHLFPLL